MNRLKRRSYLILPSYQAKLIVFMALAVFLCTVLHGVFLYKIADKNLRENFASQASLAVSAWEVLKPAIIVSNSLSFLITSVFLLIIAVLVSHRLIGPMFKVSGYLRKISSGLLNLEELRLRESDEGQILCEAANELRQAYRERFIKLNELKRQVASNKLSNDEITNRLEEITSEISLAEK